MYTLLTSYPEKGCGNTGDKLIEESVQRLLTEIKGDSDFLVLFRERELTDMLDQVNASKAVILPAFPIRDLPMHPGVYALTPDLSDIKVPLIPLGANWNVYPGDFFDRHGVTYSKATTHFLRYVANQTELVSCREYHTCRVLRRHGVDNVVMTGDPAWFDLDFLGKAMRRPSTVRRLVFTPPLSAFYERQALDLMDMLAGLFPDADKCCCFHLADALTNPDVDPDELDNSVAMNREVAEKNESIRTHARKIGFDVVLASHDARKIDFYEECDLHVGYECHAHWGFLRKRIPSVLVTEDARGVGFSYTQGIGGFDGFIRGQFPANDRKPTNTSGYCDSVESYGLAPVDVTLPERVREFLEDELESRFRRYAGLADYLDEIYQTRMEPFIESIP